MSTLDKVLDSKEKSCFKCLNFKIKPIKKSQSGNMIINFTVTKDIPICSENKLNNNSEIIEGVNFSGNSNSLSSSLKSAKRYAKIALYCDKYYADP